MKGNKQLFHQFFLFIAITVLSACGGSNSNSPDTTNIKSKMTSIEVTSTNPDLTTNITSELSVLATYDDGTTENITTDVTFVSSDTAVATVTNTSLTTHQYVDEVTITAQYQSQEATVKFNIAAPASATLSRVEFAPNTNLNDLTEESEIIVTGTYNDGSIDKNKHLVISAIETPPTGGVIYEVISDQATFKAVVVEDPNQTTISAALTELTSITIQTSNSSVVAGATISFTAEAFYSDNSTADISSTVTWVSDNTDSLAPVSTNTFLAKSIAGTANISATLNGINSNSIEISISVPTITTPSVVTLSSISIQATPGSLDPESVVTAMANAHYSDGTTKDVSNTANWSSSNTALLTRIGETNTFLAQSAGTADVSADYDGLPSNSISITINEITIPTLEEINIAPVLDLDLDKVYEGNTVSFTLTGKYSDDPTRNVAINTDINWTMEKSNNVLIETNSSGIFAPQSAGSYTIRASVSGITTSYPLSVEVDNRVKIIESIYITDDPAVSMPANTTHQLRVKAIHTDKTERELSTNLTWLSLDKEAVTVNEAGLLTSGVISRNVEINVSYIDQDSSNTFAATASVNISATNSFDFMRLQVGVNLSKTHIENRASIGFKPIIKAFNNPVGLLQNITIPSPYSGFHITMDDPVNDQKLALIIQDVNIGSFSKSTATVVYQSALGEYFGLDNTSATSLNISLDRLGGFNDINSGEFSAVLCKQTAINLQAGCDNSANQLTIAGSFAVTTEVDYEYHSYNTEDPLMLDDTNSNQHHEIATLPSYYQLLTTAGSEYTVKAFSNNAEVNITATDSTVIATNLGKSNPIGTSEHALTFIANTKVTNIEFSYSGAGDGTTFEITHAATVATAQGNASTPLILNTGDVFFNKPGQVDNTSSYYEVKVKQGYSYRVTVKPDTTQADSKFISNLSYKTASGASYNTCASDFPNFQCVIDSDNTSVFLKIDGVTTADSFSKYKITVEYNPIRAPDSFQDSFTVQLSDMVNLTGQVPYGPSPTPGDFNEGGGFSFGAGVSSYWVQGVKANTFYKIRLSGLEDGTRLWANGNLSAETGVCDPVGNANISDIYCIIKTGSFQLGQSGIALNIENSPMSLGLKGTTYTLNMEEISTTDLYYLNTFANNSTKACTNTCEVLGYAIYLGESDTPFAVSITSTNPFHNKLIHVNPGEKIFVKIHDIRTQGNTYSINISRSLKTSSYFASVGNPDEFEANNDDERTNATVLTLESFSSHSLSSINGSYNDIDWFTFTAP